MKHPSDACWAVLRSDPETHFTRSVTLSTAACVAPGVSFAAATPGTAQSFDTLVSFDGTRWLL